GNCVYNVGKGVVQVPLQTAMICVDLGNTTIQGLSLLTHSWGWTDVVHPPMFSTLMQEADQARKEGRLNQFNTKVMLNTATFGVPAAVENYQYGLETGDWAPLQQQIGGSLWLFAPKLWVWLRGKTINCFPPDTLVGTESGLRPMS